MLSMAIIDSYVVSKIINITLTIKSLIHNGVVVHMNQKHLRWTDPQTQLPASSLYPSNLPSQTASISDQPFCHNALERQTHGQMTDRRQTNRWLEGMFDDNRPLTLESDTV